MARPIPYDSNLTAWASAGTGRQVLRGLDHRADSFCHHLGRSMGRFRRNVESKMFGDETAARAVLPVALRQQVGTGIRESVWVFPIIEGTHLLGIALSVGLLCWFDLRLLGYRFAINRSRKYGEQVMPVAFVGFALMFVTDCCSSGRRRSLLITAFTSGSKSCCSCLQASTL